MWSRKLFSQHTTAAARLHAHRLCARYLLLEFPALMRTDPPPRVVELGCGVGSSLLPVLKANPGARVIATDVSSAAVCRALRLLKHICISVYVMHSCNNALAVSSTDSMLAWQ